MISCSIGLLAYNEEKNIAQLLDSLLQQDLETVKIEQIIVVSSNSTDRTDEIVREYERKDNRISLIMQPQRKGKSSAINLFLKKAIGDVYIIESADTIPASDTIEKLAAPFADETVGMTGGRPQPVNDKKSFIGFAVWFLWYLHHKMALQSPKIGEMAAFRNIVKQIPEKSAVDEASIEAIIHDHNLSIKYIPEATIRNKGPENVADFIKQRRRIYSGHLWLAENQNYTVSSQDPGFIIRITLAELTWNPIKNLKILFTISLEVWGRFLGWWDYKIKKKNPFKWDISESTKDLKKK